MTTVDLAAARIAILGTGREGRAARSYLRSLVPRVELTLIDEKAPDPAFRDSLTRHDRLVIGPLAEAGLDAFDVLVRSPGVSLYRASIQQALAAGVVVTTPTNLWFAAHRGAQTVCVTGTKGKSTTSALLAHVLRARGYTVRLAGNIGRPLLDCDDVGVDWWVVELSSYQLADLEAEPTIAVMLNLSPEHLDWHGSAEAYLRDKLRLAALAGDHPVVGNAADPMLRAALGEARNVRWFNAAGGIRAAGRRLFDGDRELDVTLPDGLFGAHNISNIAAVLTAAREIGVVPDDAIGALPGFRPLPHRLQRVGERSGVRFINDSISSTPVATVAALESLAGEPVVLIVGGLDRGLDWSPYMGAISEREPLAVIAVPDNGPRILAAMRDAGIRPRLGLRAAADLAEAVALAVRIAPAAAVVLLSPGAPSFPRFRDFRERGRQFAALCGFALDDTDAF